MIAAVVILLTAGLPDRDAYMLNVPAPAFNLPLLDGEMLNSEALYGHPVVINFWATWCAPCAVEMPELQRLYEQYQADGLRVIGINEGESPELVQSWVDNFGLTFDIGLDNFQYVGALYGLTGQPSTYVISPQGTITKIFYGPTDMKTLEDVISPYLIE